MIKQIFEKYDIIISDRQEESLQIYYDEMIQWNKKINLTAITEFEEVIYKHFVDSALVLHDPIFKKRDIVTVMDLGTGAGFPGIVLAILCPDYSFVLVDSLKKRIEFLHIIIDRLKLKNVELYHGRAEDLGRQEKFRDQFDIVVSRAVAELPVLLEYCIPFVKKNGYFISYKGKKYLEEIHKSKKALHELNSEIDQIKEYKLLEEHRILIYIKKISLTDKKYPRKAGKVKKNPIY